MPSATSRRRRGRASILLSFALILTMIVALPGHANLSNIFESSDGNLEPDELTDWNSFADSDIAGAWNFTPVYDPKDARNRDDQFSGGTKQDDECPSVRDGSFGGPDGSKVDLDRLYLANKQAPDGDEWLFVAWARVPQNSQTASSHVAYEFNKGTAVDANNDLDPLCANSDLYRRVEGDMLLVYDFPGGNTTPSIKITRWTLTGPCEVGNVSPPCWGDPTELVEGDHFDAKVNQVAVTDAVVEGGPKSLGVVEFGEAGINLTRAGVFEVGACEGFGHVTGVSRSSGSSGSAQMKDKVGPAEFEFGNCGALTVHKTDAATQERIPGATFTYRPLGAPEEANQTLPPIQGQDGVYCVAGLQAGQYIVTETSPPADYDLANPSSQTVTVSNDGSTCSPPSTTPNATFANDKHQGSILVLKTDGEALLPGAIFQYALEDLNAEHPPAPVGAWASIPEILDGDDPTGIYCKDGLDFAEYLVREFAPPPGYVANDTLFDVDVDTKSDCESRLYDDDDLLPLAELRDDQQALEVLNNPTPGTVTVRKLDDAGDLPSAGNPIAGVTFRLYPALDDGDGGLEPDTTGESRTCVTHTDGDCYESGFAEDKEPGFASVNLGDWCVVEDATSVPSGYEADPDGPQCFTIGLGSAAGGEVVDLTFINPRTHRIIVLVCHEGTDDLLASEVDLDGTVKTTLGAVPDGLNGFESADGTPITEADLCALDGASFGGLSGNDNPTGLTITYPDHPVPSDD